MSRIKHSLFTVSIIVPMLALCSISPAALAWEADKLAPWVGTIVNGKKCDGVQVPFGPYDYLQRDRFKTELQVVEESHFNADVESLVAGQSSTALDDLHYTILTWPNHHRALNSVLRYRLQHRGKWPEKSGIVPAECYLQRAIKFSPKDPIPYMLHGLLLHQMKQYNEALTSYRMANRLLPNDIITQYNMGLTLVALKKYEEAAQVAKKVYGAGFPLPGLKNKLIAAKHWKAEPEIAERNPSTPEKEPP